MNVEAISNSLGLIEEQRLEYPLVEMRSVSSEIAKSKKEALEQDHEFARSNLIEILKYAMDIMPSAVQVARETETPRQLEAVGGFLKVVAEINKDLIAISKSCIEEEKPTEATTVVNNQTAIFTGSTEDLITRLFPRKDS